MSEQIPFSTSDFAEHADPRFPNVPVVDISGSMQAQPVKEINDDTSGGQVDVVSDSDQFTPASRVAFEETPMRAAINQGLDISDQSNPLTVAFSTLLANSQPNSVIRKIVELLASDSCTPRTLKKVCSEFSVSPTDLKEEILDLIFYYVQDSLWDHTLSVEETAGIRFLNLSLGIEEGEFYNLRRERVQHLLVIEMRRILSDKTVDPAEGLYQVELQKIFGLSYDQWLELTRGPVDDIVNALLDETVADSVASEEQRSRLARQIEALDTFYVLLPSQRKKLIKPTP